MTQVLTRPNPTIDALIPLDIEPGPNHAHKHIGSGVILGRQPTDVDQLEDIYAKLDELGVDSVPELINLDLDPEIDQFPRLEEVRSGVLRAHDLRYTIRDITLEQMQKTWKSRGGSPFKPLDIRFTGVTVGGNHGRRFINLVPSDDSQAELEKDVAQIEAGIQEKVMQLASKGLLEKPDHPIRLVRNPFVFAVALVNYQKKYRDRIQEDIEAQQAADRLAEGVSQAAYGQMGKFAVMGYKYSPIIRTPSTRRR